MDTNSSSRVNESDIFADADADADTEDPAAAGAAAKKSSAASDDCALPSSGPAAAAASTASTTSTSDGTEGKQQADEEETVDSIELRKRRLLRDLQDHPERFWPLSTSTITTTAASASASSTRTNDDDNDDDESRESPTKRLKMSHVKDSEGKMNGGISPSDMDEELVQTIRAMVDSVFIKGRNNSNNSTTPSTVTDTTTTEGEGTNRARDGTTDKGENRLTTLNGSALQLLDRVQKELEKMASTERSNGHNSHFHYGNSIGNSSEGTDQSKDPTKDNNPSLPNQQSGSSSSSRKCTKVATNVLGWLCLDLKRVVQKATIENIGSHHLNQSGNRYHQLAQNGSDKIDTSEMTSLAAPSRKPPPPSAEKTVRTNDAGKRQEQYATLLCDETLPSSISGGSGADGPSENGENPSNRNDDSIHDEDGVSLLMCQESGLFAGDNINKPSASASSSTDVPGATSSVNDDSNTTLTVQHQQVLAIIRETTRLIRTKTINLTKRRVEGTTSRNNQEHQKSSSTAAAASKTNMID